MLSRRFAVCFSILACLLTFGAVNTRAQGIIWQLPKEGEMVHYEGTYKQTTMHTAIPGGKGGGNEISEWICHLDIKALGAEQAEYEGTMQSCRWFELKVTNGKSLEGLDAGPVGTRIYKVLVPEAKITEKQVDADNIPVSFLPIIKGYRKLGMKDAVPIESNVLQIYPVIAMLMNYRRLNPAGSADDLQIRLGEETTAEKKQIKSTILKGSGQIEHATGRSRNVATIWRSPEVPFGLAKWEVVVDVLSKEPNDPATAFKLTSKIEVEMHAVYQKSDAQPDPLLP